MKKLFIALALFFSFIFGCVSPMDKYVKQIDSLQVVNANLQDSILSLTIQPIPHTAEIPRIDTVYIVNYDTVEVETYSGIVAKYKVERCKYYLNICRKNSSQRKFLYSWINRALQE